MQMSSATDPGRRPLGRDRILGIGAGRRMHVELRATLDEEFPGPVERGLAGQLEHCSPRLAACCASARSILGLSTRVTNPSRTESGSALKTSSAKKRYSDSGTSGERSMSAVETLARPITAGQPPARLEETLWEEGLAPTNTSAASSSSMARTTSLDPIWNVLAVHHPARGDPRLPTERLVMGI